MLACVVVVNGVDDVDKHLDDAAMKSALRKLAESVADDFHKELSDPASGNRGEKFLWPDSYIRMSGRFTYLYHFEKKEPEAVCVIVGEQVARKRAGLPTTVSRAAFRQDPKSWVAATPHLGEIVVVDEQGEQTLRYSVQTTSLTDG